MKKITTYVTGFLFFTASFLYAQNQPQAKDMKGNAFYSGMLSKPEATAYMYGSHLLEGNVLDGDATKMNQKKPFALKSKTVDLNSFVGKKVIVIAQKLEGYPLDFGPELLEVSHIELDQEVKALGDPAKNVQICPAKPKKKGKKK